MERNQLLKRLYLLKKNPDLYRDLSNQELAEMVRLCLLQGEHIAEMLQSGIHDGYTPKEGKDYIGKKEGTQLLHAALTKALADFDKKTQDKYGKLDETVREHLTSLKDDDDTLWDIAYRAYLFLELPNFETLITQEPDAIRDALELLEGDERLDAKAIKGLDDALQTSEKRVEGRIGATVARRLGQIRDVNVEGATTGQVLTRRSDGTYDFQSISGTVEVETPVGTVNSVNASFTVSAAPKWIVSDNTTYFEGAGYSRSDFTITMDIPPSFSIRAII